MPTWLPDREADRLVWLQNYALKIATCVGTAGVTADDVELAEGWLAAYQWIVTCSRQARTLQKQINSWKTTFADGPEVEPLSPSNQIAAFPDPPAFTPTAGMFAQLVRQAERIRNTNGYTVAMGENLGIVPPHTSPTLGVPRLKVGVEPGSVVSIKWVKGKAHALLIESQRASEGGWTVLGTDTVSPYVDARPPLVDDQPEVRRYRVRYLMNDEPVGFYSPVVSVTTTP
jgi:hypothetical protein